MAKPRAKVTLTEKLHAAGVKAVKTKGKAGLVSAALKAAATRRLLAAQAAQQAAEQKPARKGRKNAKAEKAQASVAA